MKQFTAQTRHETGSGTGLWRVILSPVVWAVHFLFCYGYVAISCQKLGRTASLDDPRWAILTATAVGLGLVGLTTRRLWHGRGRSLTDNDFEYEHNTPDERHRFLSHIALMLCALSAVAMIYVTIPALLLESCR